MIECNLCGDLVHDLIHRWCYECSEEMAVMAEDLDNQPDLDIVWNVNYAKLKNIQIVIIYVYHAMKIS